MKAFNKFRQTFSLVRDISRRIETMQLALGRLESRLQKNEPSLHIQEHEFQVFSQWGDDGIIQFLIERLEIPNEIFVEFGVENYQESNTRFLLQNNNWAGLIIDSNSTYIQQLKNEPIYWRHNLKAECSFVTKDNINELLTKNGIRGDIGLLSVDIDGNDYWVWKAITTIAPRIVVCEYNHVFGPKAKVTIPYQENFSRTQAHYSNLYFGASIAALTHLAHQKGYELVGTNRAGVNVYFVRKDLLGSLPALTPEKAYIRAQFRESRAPDGTLTYLDFTQRLHEIANMSVYNLETEKDIKLREIELN